MKNRIKICFLLAGISISGLMYGQKYFTKSAQISFYSDAPLEKIEANNEKGVSVMDITTGNLEFAVLIKAFQFKKALMQEHFNENYMESNIYPKATFKGRINNLDQISWKQDATYDAKISGKLTIRGIEKEVEVNGKFNVKNGSISGHSDFVILVDDYKIKIPSIVKDKIAQSVQVTVSCDYNLMK